MFTKKNSTYFKPLINGVSFRHLVHEEETILCEFRLQKGNTLPAHSHPYEQTGYLLSGKLNFRIDQEWHLTEAGDSWCIKKDTEHEVEILEDAVVLELFSPIRPDYLP